jgi:hypothetical protein
VGDIDGPDDYFSKYSLEEGTTEFARREVEHDEWLERSQMMENFFRLAADGLKEHRGYLSNHPHLKEIPALSVENVPALLNYFVGMSNLKNARKLSATFGGH